MIISLCIIYSFLILDDAVTFTTNSTSETAKEYIKDKKGKKKRKKNTNNTVASDEIVAKKKKVKLCDEKTEVKVKKNKRDAGTTRHVENNVEKQQCNEKTKSKKSKAIDLDDMFDSVEENIKRKVDLKLQKIKKKLEAESEENKKSKKKKKDEEDYMPDLEFKNPKQKPILDVPLEETVSKEKLQQDRDLTKLRTVTNIERESTEKPDNRIAEIDPQKYLNIKPKRLKTQMPDLDTGGEDVLDDSEQEEETHRIMSEAFADDDVVEEFRKEKEQEVCNENFERPFAHDDIA